jgi:repressor LexA
MALSEKQQAILDYIRSFIRKNEYPPSIREIMNTLGISSTSVVNYNLNALVREGYITRHKELARGIRLVDGSSLQQAAQNLVRVPVLGRIVAGDPVPVPEGAFDPSQYVELTRDFVSEEDDIYALEVSGESMIDALINDGDIVVMKHQQTARNGDMVAVWLKDEKETTLKRFYHEGKRVRLQPANPSMEPIYTAPANVEIQGKVIMVIRQVARVMN